MKKTVGPLIKAVREELKLTQNEFSHYIGYDIASQSKIETGSMPASAKYLDKVCERFNVSEKYFETGRVPMFQTGTVEENRRAAKNLEVPFPKNQEANPWKDALVQKLNEQLAFANQQVERLTQVLQNVTTGKNFLKGLNYAAGTIRKDAA